MTQDPPLRDKDRVVLQHIEEGLNDVQKITSATTLENHHVSYSFQKLEEQGLIQVTRPDKMVERIIDGQKRVFQHPKQAELTQKGRKLLQQADSDHTQYEKLDQKELSTKLHQIEHRLDKLENSMEAFKKQVKQQL